MIDATEHVAFIDAICAAQRDAMAEDDSIILLGQDIAAGFPFGATKGLVDEFGPERVRNTPISEAATMGCGVGAAIAGMRPVVEVDFAGFAYLGLDQLLNNAAKIRYMSGGQVRVPLVVRVGQGPLGSFAAQHSQSLHAMLAAVPGLSVCAPWDAQSAYDLMRWALRQNDPVVMCEDLRLYRVKGVLQRGASTIAAPRADVVRPGRDLTVIAYGFGVQVGLEASDVLSGDGVEIEVLALHSLSPLDVPSIRESVRRTTRAVCVADDSVRYGVAPTLGSVATTEAWDVLAAPVLQHAARHVPVPYASSIERLVYPSVQSLVESVHLAMSWKADL